MAFDVLVLEAVTEELNEKIAGARIQQVYQPEPYTVLLYLYRRAWLPPLLLSCHPELARVHLAGDRYRSRVQPPPFCMLLRKYLAGGTIRECRQPSLERILDIIIDPPAGRPATRLVAEIMGRRSNLLLVEQQNNLILGAVKTVPPERNAHRAVLAGERYLPPPRQQKVHPRLSNRKALAAALSDQLQKGTGPEKALVAAVQGISPLTARELVFRSRWDPAAPAGSLERLVAELQGLFDRQSRAHRQPVMIREANIYAAYPLSLYPESSQQRYDSINKMLDEFYRNRVAEETGRRLQRYLQSRVKNALARLEKKLVRQKEDLERAKEAEYYRLCGDLLLTYPGMVSPGQDRVELPDPYHEGSTVMVALNPAWSVNDNAMQYYARYRKAKKGRAAIQKQIEKTRQEIAYCHGVLYNIENTGITETAALEEIRRELAAGGYIKDKRRAGKEKMQAPQPAVYKSADGTTILVGKNNRQNDYITFQAAARRDTWLHAKNLSGSHVVIKGGQFPPPPGVLEEAALLAAYFSRGRQSTAVAVDYTEVRHVRRTPGGKPGQVLYNNFRTITVNPQDRRLQVLLQGDSN